MPVKRFFLILFLVFTQVFLWFAWIHHARFLVLDHHARYNSIHFNQAGIMIAGGSVLAGEMSCFHAASNISGPAASNWRLRFRLHN